MTSDSYPTTWGSTPPDVPFKLGKAPAIADVRTVRLEPFLTGFPAAPIASPGRNRSLLASSGMLGNDSHGDCVVAEDAHRLLLWTKLAGGPQVAFSDAEALAWYSYASQQLNGSSADQGLVMFNYMKWRMKTTWKNRTYLGFGSVDPLNHEAIRQLVIAFDQIPMGVLLPNSAKTQPAPGGTWAYMGNKLDANLPGSWGGHDTGVCDYEASGVYVSTWGGIQFCTWAFWDAYVDEVYAVIPTEPVPGFDRNGFIRALKAVSKSYTGPEPDPEPTPPPPPNPIPPVVGRIVDGIGVHYSDGTQERIWPK